MLSKKLRILLVSACCVAASSCANRVETQIQFPPAADIKVVQEPKYPLEALTDPAAEAKWWDDVLLWGRDHKNKVARVCKWAKDLGNDVPAGWCG